MSAHESEIERKFLVTDPPPDLDRSRGDPVKQGYIAIADDGLEVRIRQRGDRCYLTIKQGEGRVRLEEEFEIDAERFARLWPLTDGRRIEKTRYVMPDSESGELEIELDVYAGALEDLVTAEVEFPSEEAAEQFEPPSWFGPEVTEDSRYKNRELATHGAPSRAPR